MLALSRHYLTAVLPQDGSSCFDATCSCYYYYYGSRCCRNCYCRYCRYRCYRRYYSPILPD